MEKYLISKWKNPGASWTLLSAGGRALSQDWGGRGGGDPYFSFHKVGRYVFIDKFCLTL